MTMVKSHMRESLKDHVLEELDAGAEFKAFYLKRPGTRMFCSLIVFTPEGIVIQGDLRPIGNATASSIGYDLRWFSGDLSEDYLCSKFISKSWNSELVEEDLKGIIADASDCYDDPVATNDWKQILEWWLQYGDISSQRELYNQITERGYDSDLEVGWGYPPAAGWLCALQQKFVELRRSSTGTTK